MMRVAHKGSKDKPSFCSVLWEQRGEQIITAYASDDSISIHDATPSTNIPRVIQSHEGCVTALALKPKSTCIAYGSADSSVRLYDFSASDGESDKIVITAFTKSIRALAFNKDGTMLAAAGDEHVIKLINTMTGSISNGCIQYVLEGHEGSITGIDFNPTNNSLASVDSAGTVISWNGTGYNELYKFTARAPITSSNFSCMNVVKWSPCGNRLAVPGLNNNVVIYDGKTGDERFSLEGAHCDRICFLSWLQDGKYMATSGLDNKVVLWDVAKKKHIGYLPFVNTITCMAWNPMGFDLAVVDTMGKYWIWRTEIPSSKSVPANYSTNVHRKSPLWVERYCI